MNSKNLIALADELMLARRHWLEVFHDPAEREKAKAALVALLWDDKSTIIYALRAAAGEAPKLPL